jgi:HEAT repeat protein
MPRLLAVSLGAAILFASFLSAVTAQEKAKEPELVGIKLSAWIGMLEKDKDVKQRRRAVRAVGLIGELKSKKVVPALVKALGDADDEVREAAARALGRNVSAAFAQAREDKEEELPDYDVARKALTGRLESDEADRVREACADALGQIGTDAAGSVRSLAKSLRNDKHAGTRTAAAGALRRMGREAMPAMNALEQAVADKKGDTLLRIHAAHALTQLGSDAKPSLPALKDVLADTKASRLLRRAVAEGLVRLGKDGASAAATLGAILEEKGPSEKKKVKGKKAREALRKALEEHQALRRAAVTTLDAQGSEAKGAVPALVKALDDNDRFVRCMAMHAIGQLGKDLEANREAAFKALMRGLKDPNVEVLIGAIEAFGLLGLEGLGSEAPTIVKELRAVAERDGRRSVHDAIKNAIDKIQPRKSS